MPSAGPVTVRFSAKFSVGPVADQRETEFHVVVRQLDAADRRIRLRLGDLILGQVFPGADLADMLSLLFPPCSLIAVTQGVSVMLAQRAGLPLAR